MKKFLIPVLAGLLALMVAVPVTAANGSTLTVTSPNGGENWVIGSFHAITWTCSPSFAAAGPNVNIYISRNGGLTWTPCILLTPNDGSQLWKVIGPATTQALIKIVAVSFPYVNDVSDATFNITPIIIG